MPLGSLKTVVICEPSATPAAPCAAGEAPYTLQAYVLEPSAQLQLEGLVSPVDFAQASFFWAASFAFVVSIWSLAHMFSTARRAIH